MWLIVTKIQQTHFTTRLYSLILSLYHTKSTTPQHQLRLKLSVVNTVQLNESLKLLNPTAKEKKPLAAVPGVGWSLQMLMHVFLNRNFDNDKDHIVRMFDYYKSFFDNIMFVLYPEGTVFWPDTKVNVPVKKQAKVVILCSSGKIRQVCRITGTKSLQECFIAANNGF